MSEVLARLRVRETAGIRRFLYPLMATVELPINSDISRLWLADADDRIIPTEFPAAYKPTGKTDNRRHNVNFAVSLAPFEETELTLTMRDPESNIIDDPLNIQRLEDGGLENHQKRFSVSVAANTTISQVVYDNITHLRYPDNISLNGVTASSYYEFAADAEMPKDRTNPQILIKSSVCGAYSWKEVGERSIGDFLSVTTLTACKSWVERYHWIQEPIAGDEVVFTLPLAITSPTLTCDFGVGGYVFGKLDDKATEIVWHTEFGEAPYAKWTVATAGRVDYVGEVATAEEFRSQRWFHLIDSDKALAVAITILPDDCRELTVRMTHDGDVSVAFKLGNAVTEHPEEHVDFGVCYHFLNDVPAIAAATNPQSILLPPVVEVL